MRELRAELALWRAAGRVATFWWRDDDAERPTPELRALLDLAAGHPIALAVVPAGVDPALGGFLAAFPGATVWQHGWSHTNHAPAGQPTCELGGDWPMAAMVAALRDGHARLRAVFGARFQPVLVPPWNRMTPALVPHLPGLGFTAISLGPGGHRRLRHPRVAACHARVDLSDWRQGGRFIGRDDAIGKIVRHLAARRLGQCDSREPTGILTHHLVMDAATFGFVGELLELAAGEACVRWLGAEAVPRPQESWEGARLWIRRWSGRNWPGVADA